MKALSFQDLQPLKATPFKGGEIGHYFMRLASKPDRR